MKLAWKEIKHSISKYLLIEFILVLMIFMVVFLSGLANGLGWAISGSIEKTDAEYFVMSTDAEKLISISNVDTAVLEQVASQSNDNVTNLSIKRSNINTLSDEQKLVVGSTLLDYNALTVTVYGVTMEMPPKEFYLLFKLLSNPNKIFTRQELMDEIWGMDTDVDDRTIDSHIKKLRRKFEHCDDFEIVTIRGLGYKSKI